MCLAGRTPLVYAVISENAVVVKYLLDHGADPNKADDDRLTPLHSAAGIGHISIHMHLCFGHVHHNLFLTSVYLTSF